MKKNVFFNNVKLYIISGDIIFVKSLTKKISEQIGIWAVHHANGEGFFRQIVHDPPLPKDIVLVMIDYNLKNIENTNEKDGLTVLSDIRQFNRNYFCIFLADNNQEKIKEIALASGAYTFFTKNDNTPVRLINAIKQLENNIHLIKEKKKTFTSIALFILFIAFSSIILWIIK